MQRSFLSLACFAGAGAWPSLLTAFDRALASPLERVVRSSICGSPLHADYAVWGHCAACWGGAGALFAAGALMLLVGPGSAPRGFKPLTEQIV